MSTKIEWATETWNPIRTADGGYHCTKVSEGCQHCYAERMNKRFGNGKPFDDTPTEFVLDEKQWEKPLHWNKPRRIFVQSMGDLFHEDVPDSLIDEIMTMIARCPRHTFIFLTKRPERMKGYINRWLTGTLHLSQRGPILENLWLGVTCENQKRADERIPILLQIPAAVRFVSIEPMLGPVDLTSIRFDRNTIMNVLEGCGTNRLSPCQSILNAFCNRINWTIVGGETGPGARPMHPDWVRSLVLQCINAGVPFFFKSCGEWMPSYQTGATFELRRLKTDEVVMSGPGHGVVMKKVGKKAGRILDGRTWDEMPEVRP